MLATVGESATDRFRLAARVKHDGFRIIARRDGGSVRLLTRNGYDFSARFPLIVAAVEALPAVSCVVDGEAIACDERGLVRL